MLSNSAFTMAQEVEQRYLFAESGTLVVAVSYAHLFVPINLKPLKEYVAELREAHAKVVQNTQGNTYVHKAALSQIEMEIESCERRFKEIQILLEYGQVEQARTLASYKSVRTKRQIFIGLMGALLGGLGTATIMGLFGHGDIDAIVDRVNEIDKKTDLVVKAVNANHVGIIDNSNKITKLRQAVTQIGILMRQNTVDRNVQMAGTLANALFQQFNLHYDQYVNAYVAATNTHRLHPGIVQVGHLNSTFQDIIRSANRLGFNLFSHDFRSLFQFEASYTVIKPGTFAVIVHIPTALPKNIFKLYHFTELPIKFNNASYAIVPEKEYFAVFTNPLTQEEQYYISLSAQELATCDKFHNSFLCPELNVARKLSDPDCTAHLYQNHHIDALKTCPFHITKPKPYAIRKSRNTFQTFLPWPGKGNIQCLNGTKKTFPVNKFDTITVDDGCWGDVDTLRLFSSAKMPTEKATHTFHWEIDLVALLKNVSTADIDAIIHNTNRTGKPPKELQEFQEYIRAYHVIESHEKPLIKPTHQAYATIGICVLLALLLVCFLVCCVCRGGTQVSVIEKPSRLEAFKRSASRRFRRLSRPRSRHGTETPPGIRASQCVDNLYQEMPFANVNPGEHHPRFFTSATAMPLPKSNDPNAPPLPGTSRTGL